MDSCSEEATAHFHQYLKPNVDCGHLQKSGKEAYSDSYRDMEGKLYYFQTLPDTSSYKVAKHLSAIVVERY